MESYIVRVYRRNRDNVEEVAGLVETVGTDEKTAFQSFSGLVTAIKHAIARGGEHTPSLSARRIPFRDSAGGVNKRAG